MDPFERKIKTKIYDHSAKVPDHIWMNIEKALPDKEYKILPILWIAGCALFLLISIFIYLDYFNSKIKKSPSDNASIIQFIKEPSAKNPLEISNLELISKRSQNQQSETIVPSKDMHTVNNNQSNHQRLKNSSYDQDINVLESGHINKQVELNELTYTDLENSFKSSVQIKEKKVRYTPIQPIDRIPIKSYQQSSPNVKEQLICPSTKESSSALRSFEIYAGADYPFRMLTSKTNESQQIYIDGRNRSENTVISFHGGIRFVQPITNNMAIKLGGEYAQITERFQLVDSGAVRVQTVIDSIFAPDGSLTDIQTRTITENGIRAVNNYNEIRTITIPVSMGYYHKWNNTTAFIHLGAQFTILSSYSGKILSPHLNAVLIGSDPMATLQPFKDNFGINLIGSAGILYSISDKWSYFIEPNFRYTINSLSRSGYPLNQKFLTIGLSAGLNYKF